MTFAGINTVVVHDVAVLDAHYAAGVLRDIFGVGDQYDGAAFGMKLFQ